MLLGFCKIELVCVGWKGSHEITVYVISEKVFVASSFGGNGKGKGKWKWKWKCKLMFVSFGAVLKLGQGREM